MPCSERLLSLRWLRSLTICLLLVHAGSAWAHKSSDAYMQFDLQPGQVRLRWDIALRDLDTVLDIDADGDGKLFWLEVRTALPRMQGYALAHLAIPGCPLHPAGTALEQRADGTYLVLYLESACVFPATAKLRYTLFADTDPTHRGIATIQRQGRPPQLLLLDPGAAPSDSGADDGGLDGLRWVTTGMRHILGGYDHLLFLVCLLLPAVLGRTDDGRRPVARWQDAALPVLGIVTAFTLAHSITLGLAAGAVLSLPSAWIEPAIAATIMLAAADNLYPMLPRRRALVVFAFGLVHGFGFAGALSELHLPRLAFGIALLEFNVGLELGQLLIVGAAISVLFALRKRAWYARVLVHGGSSVAFLIATLWLIERLTGSSLMPF
jgi:hypothetical protein